MPAYDFYPVQTTTPWQSSASWYPHDSCVILSAGLEPDFPKHTLELSLRGISILPDGVVNAASLRSVTLSGDSILRVLGVNLGTAEINAPASGPVVGLGGMTVELADASMASHMPLYYVGRGQVNPCFRRMRAPVQHG